MKVYGEDAYIFSEYFIDIVIPFNREGFNKTTRKTTTIQPENIEEEVIQDIGSRMNYYKKGLTKLIDLILDNQIQRLILTHKDRILRFGAELVFSICEAKNVEVIIINQGDETPSFEEELAKDVLEIITVFSARLYGSRSKKNKKLISDLEKVVERDFTENKN